MEMELTREQLIQQLETVRSRAKAMERIATHYKRQLDAHIKACRNNEIKPEIVPETVSWWLEDIIVGNDSHLPTIFCKNDMTRRCVDCEQCK